MKKQDIGLAYEISTLDLKEPNFLKALGTVIVAVILFLAFAKIFTVVVQLIAISLLNNA